MLFAPFGAGLRHPGAQGVGAARLAAVLRDPGQRVIVRGAREEGVNVAVIIPESGEVRFPTFAERVLGGVSIGTSIFRRASASLGVCGTG